MCMSWNWDNFGLPHFYNHLCYLPSISTDDAEYVDGINALIIIHNLCVHRSILVITALWIGDKTAQSLQWLGYGLYSQGSIPGTARIFSLSQHPDRPNQLPIQRVLMFIPWLRFEADHTPPSAKECKELHSHTSAWHGT
jgi:hypothetical protein